MVSESAGALRILFVEDDERLARFTRNYLETQGLTVTVVADGATAVREAAASPYDAVVLDVMLPKLDGFEVCRAIRRTSDVPIVVVTAKREEADRVLGLELGADDYVTKPFSARELLARIRANVRRARGLVSPGKIIRRGALVLDVDAFRARLSGRDLGLTPHEFALLRALAERVGRVLSREQLLEITKGSAEEAFDRSIDVRVSRLRAKLGDDPRRPSMLHTVRGVGYMLVVRGDREACED